MKYFFLNRSLLFSLSLTLLVWIIWYAYTTPDSFLIIKKNWPIALTMVFGSFIAGATSEGGGAIAFPVFTKILQISPQDAKVFSLAIQSIGMSAASFTIIIMRVPIEWRVIFWSSLGGIFGISFSSIIIAPSLPADLVKMLFTAMITSFALTLGLVNWKQRTYNDRLPFFYYRERTILIACGFFGGIMTGLVGSGIDIISFSIMVLLFHLSEKVATPTSVVLMAINAIAGFVLHSYIIDGFTSKIEEYWLAAIPVVIIGAPAGAYLCTRLDNKTIAFLLIGLIFLELISSLLIIPLTGKTALISLSVFFLFSFIYYRLSISTKFI